MQIKELLIFCNANSSVGFGHISRCVNLAKMIEIHSEIKITFAGNISEIARTNFLKDYNSILHCNLPELLEKATDFQYVLIDSYDLNQEILNELVKYKKVILIDDFCELNYQNVDLVINFTISGPKFDYNSKKQALGLDFIILNQELINIRNKNILRNNHFERNEISIFMGGGFKDKTFLNKIAKLLHLKYDFKKIKILTSLTFETEKYIEIIPLNSDISFFLNNSEIILSGGGLMKYEAAFCLIPNLTISVTDEQDWETIQFEKQNLTFRIGKIGDSLKEFEEKFGLYFNDNSNLKQFILASENLFKNVSALKLVEKIKSL